MFTYYVYEDMQVYVCTYDDTDIQFLLSRTIDNKICVPSPDLVCDGVQHCGHGQDEDVSNNCAGKTAGRLKLKSTIAQLEIFCK